MDAGIIELAFPMKPVMLTGLHVESPCFNQGGEFFGEYSCLMGRKRACSVTAAHASEIYILSKKILESALKKWPELAVELHEMGEASLFALLLHQQEEDPCIAFILP